jgi:hypothetical protein
LSARTPYAPNVAASNCIGPSAPPSPVGRCTSGAAEEPLPDSIVPIAARTCQGRPGQVLAAPVYMARYLGGTLVSASADGVADGVSRAIAGSGTVAAIRPAVVTARSRARFTYG